MEKKVISGFIPGTETFINEYMLSLKNSIIEGTNFLLILYRTRQKFSTR